MKDFHLIFCGQTRFTEQTIEQWASIIRKMHSSKFDLNNFYVHYRTWDIDSHYNLIDKIQLKNKLLSLWGEHNVLVDVEFYDYNQTMSDAYQKISNILGSEKIESIKKLLIRTLPQSLCKSIAISDINPDSISIVTRTDLAMNPEDEFYNLLYKIYFKNNFTNDGYDVAEVLNVESTPLSLTPHCNDQFMIAKTAVIQKIFSDKIVENICDFLKFSETYMQSDPKDIPHVIFSHLIRDKNIRIWGQVPHILSNSKLIR